MHTLLYGLIALLFPIKLFYLVEICIKPGRDFCILPHYTEALIREVSRTCQKIRYLTERTLMRRWHCLERCVRALLSLLGRSAQRWNFAAKCFTQSVPPCDSARPSSFDVSALPYYVNSQSATDPWLNLRPPSPEKREPNFLK